MTETEKQTVEATPAARWRVEGMPDPTPQDYELGLSQEKVAEGLDVTFQQLQKYENGSNRISSSRLQQLSGILKKPVSRFFDEGGATKSKDGDLASRLIVSTGGVRLAEAFLAIKDDKKRTAAIHVIEALAA